MTTADAAVDLTAALVGIDSVNPTLVPGAAGERAAAEFLADRLVAQGFDVDLLEPDGMPGRTSLLASLDFGPGRAIVLNGHLDTVGVEGMDDPFTARIDGDRMFGRGTCDMKAGVAGMVVAAEALAADPPSGGQILLAMVADEEDASVGTPAVIADLADRGMTPDVAVVGEPSWLDLAVAHRGFAVMRAELVGRATHTSRKEEGVDAIAALARLILAAEEHDRRLADAPPHPLLRHGSSVVSVVRGGTAPFTVAAEAQAWVERRTLPGATGADALAELEDMLTSVRAAMPDITTSAVMELDRSPWEVDPASASTTFMDAVRSAAIALGAHQPEEVGAPYWMESALWQGAGIPAVVYGPAGGSLHAIDEWVSVEQVRAYPAMLETAMRTFLPVT